MMTANDVAEIGELRPNPDYQAFLDQGRFMLLRDRATGEAFFYPRIMAPVSGSRDLEWFAPSGRGTVYAATVIHKRPPTPNYNVVLIDLAEGPRVLSRVEGIAPEDVTIGMAVQARVGEIDGKGLLLFDPVSAGGQAA